MVGDFVENYGCDEEEGQWDAVVTCFFIDTATDVLNYLRTIHHTLRAGGVWINLGPLLWHHDETGPNPAAQLSMEEIAIASDALGLKVGPMEEV